MAKKYLKSEKDYDKVDFDKKKALEGAKKISKRKVPTSVALDKSTVVELKIIAEEKGIPYQVLMRSLILEGLRKLKK